MEVNPRFFDSVNYENPQTIGEKFANAAENYYDLGGRKFTIMPRDGDPKTVEFTEKQHEMWSTAKKAVVTFTLIIPLILLIGKAIFRAIHSFVKKAEKGTEAQEPLMIEEKAVKWSLFKDGFRTNENEAKKFAKSLKGRVKENEWVINEFGDKQYLFSMGKDGDVKIQKVGRMLGSGAFGLVSKLKDLKTKKVTVLKFAVEPSHVEHLKNEVANLEAINRTGQTILGIQEKPLSGVVKVQDVAKSRALYGYESELYDGNLQQLLNDKNVDLTEHKLAIAKQIVGAIAYLHQNEWYHGDLKPQNILYRIENGEYKIKIIDFAGSTQNPVDKNELMSTAGFYPRMERHAAASSGKNENFKQIEIYALGKVLCRLFGVHTANNPRNVEKLQEALGGNKELADTILQMIKPTTVKKTFLREKTVWNRPTIEEVQAAFRR